MLFRQISWLNSGHTFFTRRYSFGAIDGMAFLNAKLLKYSAYPIRKCLTALNGLPRIQNWSATKYYSSASSPEEVLITPIHSAKEFVKECLTAVGTSEKNAAIVAENLVTADYRGYYSHGMNRLEFYIRDIKQCSTNPNACPVIVKETRAVALVDGKHGLGAVIGTYCMQKAIEKAKECGLGFVTARGCSHYGLASFYPLQAMKQGLIGLSVSNSSPLMCPLRAKNVALGTNPISLGANACQGDSFVLDIATTAVSIGKIDYHRIKGEPIPVGWALNEEGQPETDPTVAVKSARLIPLGGTEEHSGYKGYGLAMLVEILSGLLAGSDSGPNIRKWSKGTSKNKSALNLGTAYLALDPEAFEPGFEKRLGDLLCYLRNMEPVDPTKPVMVHGDFERLSMAKVDKEGGLRYVENQHKTMKMLAEELKVELPCSVIVK